MNKNQYLDPTLSEGPEAALEQMLIDAYLHEKGFRRSDLASLPVEQARRLRIEAYLHADLKLAEFEARAAFRHKIEAPV